jgi:hypothetical protein
VLRHARRLGGKTCARRTHQAEEPIPTFLFMWPLRTLRLSTHAPAPSTVPGDPIPCAGSSAAGFPSSRLPTSSAPIPPSVGPASLSSRAPPRHSASAETGARASPASRPRYSVAFRCPKRGFGRFRPQGGRERLGRAAGVPSSQLHGVPEALGDATHHKGPYLNTWQTNSRWPWTR